MPGFLLVADDHTGACDAGAAFAASGWRVDVLFDPARVEPGRSAACAVSLDVRRKPPEHALRRIREFCRALAQDVALFVKIDSTLDEGSAVFLRDLCAILNPGRIVVAPANPSQGRAVVNGELVVYGERTGKYVAQWLPPVSGMTYYDAGTAGELDDIVARAPAGALLAGSGGLAQALARRCAPETRYEPPALGPVEKILVIAGSQQPATREQVGVLQRAAFPCLEIKLPEQLYTVGREWFDAGHALIVAGGDTLACVTAHLRINQVTLWGEPVPGVVISRAPGGAVLASKPGGFGARTALVDTVRFLRSQR